MFNSDSQYSRSVGANTTAELAVVALDIASANASDTLSWVRKLARGAGGVQKSVLSECAELYSVAGD